MSWCIAGRFVREDEVVEEAVVFVMVKRRVWCSMEAGRRTEDGGDVMSQRAAASGGATSAHAAASTFQFMLHSCLLYHHEFLSAATPLCSVPPTSRENVHMTNGFCAKLRA